MPAVGANRVTRRGFLQRAVRLAAGAVVFPYPVRSAALGKAGTAAPSNRITVGCIGTGSRGRYNMRAFMGEPDVEVVAVCDVDATRREEAAATASLAGNAVYSDFRRLLDRQDIDAVVISTPDHWHVPIAAAAAKAGKDIYCEKPLTHTIAEGRILCETVERYGRVLQVGSQQRSDWKFQWACRVVRTGGLGRLKIVRVGLPGSRSIGPQPVMAVPPGFDYDTWLGPAPWQPYTKARCHGRFRHIFDYSGGKFVDWGAHHLDIVQMALDAERSGPVWICGRGRFPKDGIYDTALEYDIDFFYADGTRVNASTANRGGITFEGTEGRLFVDRQTLEVVPESLLRGRPARPSASKSHVRDFLDCVKQRRTPVAAVEAGHRSATVCHLGNISMLLGRSVHWDPEKEDFINDEQARRMIDRSRRSPWCL